MKIIEAIERVDAIKPNGYTQTEKIEWLSVLDGMIKRTVLDRYEGDEIEFDGYDDDTPLDTELLVRDPYDEIYLYWLESKIDYANGEIAKYNNSSTRFNDTFTDFKADYNRQNMPKGQKMKYW